MKINKPPIAELDSVVILRDNQLMKTDTLMEMAKCASTPEDTEMISLCKSMIQVNEFIKKAVRQSAS